MGIIENKNFLTEEELEQIKVLNSDEFPWYFANSGYDNYDKPFFSHTIISRHPKSEPPIINSEYYDFYIKIFNRFCDENGIEYKRILRMNLNFSWHFDAEFYSALHQDHNFPHQLALIYLSGTSGNTVLVDDDMNIQMEITPEVGKVVSFDGEIMHTIRPCDINEHRIICVITYN